MRGGSFYVHCNDETMEIKYMLLSQRDNYFCVSGGKYYIHYFMKTLVCVGGMLDFKRETITELPHPKTEKWYCICAVPKESSLQTFFTFYLIRNVHS